MTTLKFKDTDGTWKLIPIIGPPGAGVPAGGALGDVLIKQSATDRDTRWGINPPKLHLTEMTAASMAGINTTPLTLGDNASTNVVGYSTGFQARNNGAIALLRLNYYGGDVAIGGTQGIASKLHIGDDAMIGDVNVAHALGIVSQTDSTRGALKLGGAVFHGLSNYYHLTSPSLAYYDANQHYFRNSAGGDIGRFDGTNWVFNAGSVYVDGDIYSGNNRYIQVRGTSNHLYWSNYGGGWYMTDTLWMRTTGDKGVWLGGGTFGCDGHVSVGYNGGTDGTWRVRFAYNTWVGGQLRAAGGGDGCYVDYTMNANYAQTRKVAGGSWGDSCFLANPGNTMAGYAWHPGGVAGQIRMQVNNGKYHMNNSDAGWYYNIIASGFEVASSVEFKRGVIDLAVDRPIDVVRRLRPRWFQTPTDLDEPMAIYNEDGMMIETRSMIHDCDLSPHCSGTSEHPCQRVRTFEQGRVGFIAEELAESFPVIAAHDNDGRVIGYDLSGLVALLVGAIHNLNDRIETLEAA